MGWIPRVFEVGVSLEQTCWTSRKSIQRVCMFHKIVIDKIVFLCYNLHIKCFRIY